MGIDVSASTRIARPAEKVAAYAMEAENEPAWISGISSARRLTPDQPSSARRSREWRTSWADGSST